MAAHNCPVPSNRQKHLECGGPGVGICIEGKCQCEPQYTGFACGDCALEHESIPAPEWGVNHSFCSKGTTPSISVSQIHTPPISTDTPLQSSANNTTGLVLGVAGALVVVMAIALLYAVRHRHKSRAQFSDSSDVMDAMKQDSDESEGQGASTSRDRFATETVAVDQSRESVLVEMDTIISNPLASQAQQGNVCTRCNAQMRACSLGAPAGSSSCDLILQHSRTPLMRSNSGQGRDSPTARGLTWVAQVRSPCLMSRHAVHLN